MGPLQQPLEHQIATLPKNQSGRIPSNKDGSIKNPLGTGLALAGIVKDIIGWSVQRHQNELYQRQQNEYNERMQDKMNDYNSPEAQIQRYIEAGFTESQARQMIFGSPTAGLQQTPVQGANLAGSALNPFEGLDVGNAFGQGQAISQSIEESNLTYQQAVQQQIVNDYIRNMTSETLRGLALDNDRKSVENQMLAIQNRIAHTTADAQEQALLSEFTKQIVINSPFGAFSLAEQSSYINNMVSSLMNGSEAEKTCAQFLKEINDYKLEHVGNYQTEEYWRNKEAVSTARTHINSNNADNVWHKYVTSRESFLRSCWDASYGRQRAEDRLETAWNDSQIPFIRAAGIAYIKGQTAQFKYDRDYSRYQQLIVDFLSKNFHYDYNVPKKIAENISAILQPVEKMALGFSAAGRGAANFGRVGFNPAGKPGWVHFAH